jgi:hypothetical protein
LWQQQQQQQQALPQGLTASTACMQWLVGPSCAATACQQTPASWAVLAWQQLPLRGFHAAPASAHTPCAAAQSVVPHRSLQRCQWQQSVLQQLGWLVLCQLTL